MNLYKEWKLKQELKKHYKKQMKMSERKNDTDFLLILSIVGLTFLVVIYFLGYRFKVKDLTFIGIMTLLVINLILWISNYRLRKDINLYQRGEDKREAKLIQCIEDKTQEKKQQITHIILKNDEGYDIKTWNVGKAHSLVIGKSSRVRVDIDLREASQSALISKNHAILNKTDNGWFLEDLGSINGTGVQKLSDNRKIKVKASPVKVESGDIIYIATTALLIK